MAVFAAELGRDAEIAQQEKEAAEAAELAGYAQAALEEATSVETD